MHRILKIWFGRVFATVFLGLSLLLILLTGYQFFHGLQSGKELTSLFIHALNTVIIALALFELGIGIAKEYAAAAVEEHTFFVVRRMIARFVGTVCIALVLESLIMIIKYSQLDLAGNLFYPVGILIGASVLLAALGVFLQLSRSDVQLPVKLGEPHTVPLRPRRRELQSRAATERNRSMS